MKKFKFSLLYAAIIAVTLLVQTNCAKEDFDTVPVLDNVPTWQKSVSIQEVRNLLSGTTTSIIANRADATNLWDTLNARGIIDSAIVFEGTIISCDSAGNFYKTVTIMDETAGIDLTVADKNLYVVYGFKPGQKVRVRVNDLAIGSYYGMVQIGIPETDYTDTGTELDMSGVPVANMDKVVQLVGRRGTVEPEVIDIRNIPSTCTQRLVRVDSVQFRGEGLTFTVNGNSTNRVLINSENYALLLRTSGYALYGSETLPTGNGSVTGVMGIYNSTYQLLIRDLNDIKFDKPAFNDEIPTPNKTIAQLKALCTSNLVQINSDVVVEGVITGNDAQGNIYKQIFIEDESGAIQFNVDIADVNSNYPVGSKIIINCNELYVGKYGGVVQLGTIYNGGIGRISEADFYRKVFTVDGTFDVNIIETSIADVNDNMIGRVIKLPQVQFIDTDLGETYAGTATTNQTLTDAEGRTILVRTSNYANFAGNVLPEGSGSFSAVLSKYNQDYQLYIRDINEVELDNPRFEVTGPEVPEVNTTIAELKAMCTSNLIQITSNIVIEGVIVADDQFGNIYKTIYVADETGGIPFKINAYDIYETHPVGTKVVIDCQNFYLGTYGNLVQLGTIYNGSIGQISATDFANKVFITETGLTVEPTVTTIPEFSDSMLGTLIKLENVHFQTTGVNYTNGSSSTSRTLVDVNGNTVVVYTSNYADFANSPLPTGSGTFVAVLSKYYNNYQLIIRNTTDINFAK